MIIILIVGSNYRVINLIVIIGVKFCLLIYSLVNFKGECIFIELCFIIWIGDKIIMYCGIL